MERPRLRFAWDHNARLHRSAVRLYNRVARHVPFSVKYGLGRRLAANGLPYTLIPGCRTLVQIGAPRDTLMAGRSRGMYFSLLADPGTRVIVIEPDSESVAAFRAECARRAMNHVTVVESGVWREAGELTLLADPDHPASNLVSGTLEIEPERRPGYQAHSICVDSLDSILAGLGVHEADLVSITTNGSEREIIAGMDATIAAGLRFICLARTDPGLLEFMATKGFELMGHDDRGYTFRPAA